MEQDQQPSRAEQRMLAVAKLKRAASLPRMKDGRRPPMHVEAVSEGEKAQVDEEAKEESDPPQLAAEEPLEAELEADADVEEAERAVSPGPTARSKRRSRSRSRSRGSKDLRGKIRALQSPTPTSQVAGDSSPDEAPHPPPLNLAGVTPLISPIPANLLELQQSRLLRSPTPTSPDIPINANPFPQSPGLLPTLEAWQRGLFRSNSAGGSAAGRMMAMHKLTGGTETYDPFPMSPAPSPLPGKLGRNNTVTGGERTAARQLMLSRLGGRITKETDGEQASGEERSAPSPTPKRRRRRSRRGSASANTGISDSEFLSTSPSTPVVPPTPLPTTFDALPDIRSRSATPYQLANPPNHEADEVSDTQKPAEPIQEYERIEPTRRRSVVVEEDEEERYPPPKAYPGLPNVTNRHIPAQVASLRLPHASDAPSNGSSDSAASPSAVSIPVYINQRTPPGNDAFPRSPYVTPLKEVADRDDDEEQVLYHADTYRPHTLYDESFEREISWIASPVPELDIRMPIDDDEEDHDADRNEEEDPDLDEPPLTPRSSEGFTPEEHEAFDDTSPRVSSDSKSLVVESETSAVISPSQIPLSPSGTALSQTVSVTRASDESTSSPQTYPTRLSVASRSPLDGESAEWDDRILNAEISSKRNVDTPSTWEKMKSTFSRAGSSSGRRSRSNSILTRDRRDHTDSSISRESGASLTSARADKGDVVGTFAQQQTQPSLMQTTSASVSILSLAPHTPVRGGPSPIPPPTSTDMSKYQNAKLFPFPGMKKLEEQRNRAKGLPSASASSPDIIMLSSSNEEEPPLSASSYNNTPAPTPDMTRERKLSHQASDTRLISKYNPPSSAPVASHPEYIDITPQSPVQNGGSLNLKLPMTLPGVKQWLSKNNKKLFSSSQSSSPSSSAPISSPIIEPRSPPPPNSNSAPEAILRKDSEPLGTDWEEVGTTPTSTSGDTLGKRSAGAESQGTPPETSNNGPLHLRSELTETEKTPKAKKVMPPMDLSDTIEVSYFDDSPSTFALPTRSDPLSSTSPDPRSSSSDYPAHSTSESSSTTSSQYSLGAAGHQGPAILERLEEDLSRGSRGRIWSAVDLPPRGLLLSSPVFQVVNTNTLKDRFLFLFTDILVIAKPVISDQDTFVDSLKPNPLDRKFVVKSVVMLNQLQFKADRNESHEISNRAMSSRNPDIRSFIHNFSRDPDSAINSVLTKTGKADDGGIIGQLLFNTLELDRVRLGEYLSQRTSKASLRCYLDNFGFLGLRIDNALRVFLLSIGIPPRNSHNREYLLDAFAGRWYEANVRIVDFDKDLAHRLVRAIVQLNELLHDEISQEPGPTGYPLREVTSRDFVEAFRRYDQRSLVSDELLVDLYTSILKERLSQAPRSSVDSSIVIKRAIPPRLTWKVQSEPIVLRIPHADADLTIQFYGHDLVFDPPFLNFAKSAEASFRVTGLSLGPKSMIMCRSGPNALKYGSLPLSSPVVVERAFMRHTFQLAFLNHNGVKRRYMFSVDDFLLRHQWVLSIKRQVDKVAESSTSSPSKFNRAAEAMTFRALQETLMGSSPAPVNLMRTALQRLHGGPFNHTGSPRSIHDRTFPANTNGCQIPPLHVRSKSRSKVYHRHGAGKNEMDLIHSPNYRGSRENDNDEKGETPVMHDSDQHLRQEGPLWSAQDIEVHCKQNSAIPSILLHLQATATEEGGS